MSNQSRFSQGDQENLPAVPGSVQVVRHVAPAARPAAGQSQAFTPQLIFMALRRWWMVALPVGIVLATVAAAVVWFQFVPEYQATAHIQIDSKRTVIAFDTEGNTYGRDDTYVATQLNLLGSNIILLGSDAYLKGQGAKSVVQQLLDGEISGWQRIEASDKELIASRNLDPSARQIFLANWLSKNVSVQPAGKGSSIYQVSFRSVDAEFSQSIVNAIVNTYFDVLEAQRGQKDEKLLVLLRQERSTRQPELAKKQAELDRLIAGKMKEGAFVELSPEAGDPRLPLRAQFLEAELEKAVIEAEIKSLTEAADNPIQVPDDRVERAIDQDPYVLELRRQMRELARFATDIDSSAASPNNPESRRIRAQIADITEELDAYRNEVRPAIREELAANQQQSRAAALAEVAARQKNNQAVLTALRQQQEDILGKLTDGSSASLDVERKKFELELERDVLARIENRIIQLETESAAPPQEQLWRWADKPVTPLVELPYKQWLMFVPAMFFAPFLLAVGWERILQRVHSVDTLEKDLQLEVMGEIARFPKRNAAISRISERKFDDALRLFEESVDTLGTSLRLSDELRNHRVLAVTSAAANEGKTSVAAQLAVSISQATHAKTLLIDGDMRSPDLHQVFGIALEPGLEDVLIGDCQLSEAIVTDWSENLHVLPAGKLGVNPHQLLANGTARELMAKLSDDYRYIIIDTPPILAAGEAMILCEAADATLICAMYEVSRADQVRRACKRLAMVGVQPTGTILNGVPASHYSSRYGKYHAYVT